MKRFVGRFASTAFRLFYLLANWKAYLRFGQLRYGPGRGAGDLSQEIVDRFHSLFYEAQHVPGGWKCVKWMGVEALKCPFDLWSYQEILHELQPDLVVETGTARGGSALFIASVFDLIGSGEVVSIDIVDGPSRPRHPRITYLQGSSTSPRIAEEVKGRAARAGKVMVILDSDHRKAHVLEEMELYASLVTSGQYLVVEDTNVNGHPVLPGIGPGPMEAVREFLRGKPPFVPDRARERFLFSFNPGGYLRRL